MGEARRRSRVGAEAVKVLLTVEPGPVAPVAVALKTINVGRRIPRPERVKACIDICSKPLAQSDATECSSPKRIVLLDAVIRKQPRVDVEVQAIQIGPAVFVSNPAEYFVEYGLGIKRESPFPFTFPVELANGIVGYVPTEEALGLTAAATKTRLTYYSNLEPTAGNADHERRHRAGEVVEARSRAVARQSSAVSRRRVDVRSRPAGN